MSPPSCEGGQAVDFLGKTIKARIHSESAVGVPCFSSAEGFLELRNGSETLVAGADFGIPCGGTGWYSFSNTPTEDTVTELSFVFRVFSNWTGTFYLDDVRIE